MQIVYAKDTFPQEVKASIFLAGPTPRDKSVPSWRPQALLALEEAGFDGHVFVPEPMGGTWRPGYDDQVEWEEEGLNRADCILFWIPRDMAKMPALTTNDEWGTWKDSGKVVLGTPPGAPHVRYQEYYAAKLGVPQFRTLKETAQAAVAMTRPTGKSTIRVGAECTVPTLIWTLSTFQAWYQAQKAAGNRLDGARVKWTARVGPHRGIIFAWVVQVNVFIASESRNKTNEFVFGRPDISTVVLWKRAPTLEDTEVILVKEFRSPARTQDAFIRELPGGSSKETKSAIETAVEEAHEEAGITLDPKRLKEHTIRQVAGTLSSFAATAFSAELTDAEMAKVRSTLGTVRGVVEDSERTYVEIARVGDLLKKPATDWATLGMIFSALSGAMR